MNAKLYVGNLSYNTTQDQLTELFSQAGTVVDAVVIMDRQTNQSKGFGFVTMSSPEEAKKAIEMYDNKDHDGREMRVSEARPQKPREDFGNRAY